MNRNDTVKRGLFEKKSLRFIYILLFLPFFYMDLGVRLLSEGSGFYPWFMPGANVFTLIYAGLIIALAKAFGKRLGRLFYGICLFVVWLLFFVHIVYYHLTEYYFSCSLLQMASEGSSYMIGVLRDTPAYIWVMAVAGLFFSIAALILMTPIWEPHETTGVGNLLAANRKNRKFDLKKVVLILVVFIILHTLAPFTLGKAYDSLKWKSFKNPRNVYNTFSDVNKCMRISGLCEYSVRDLYMNLLKPKEKITSEEEAFLQSCFSEDDVAKENLYTGIFKGKNVIFLQLEGMDSWLLNEQDTPNLYALKQRSMDFTDHYSMYTGGGSTFNSEFSVNTGYTTPSSYNANVYTLNSHQYPGTMPALFKQLGYQVNAYHMNSGEFYSRGINYKSWGFDSYNDLISQDCYTDESYVLDREMILNQDFYKKMFQSGEPFVNYLITYTPHTPFTFSEGVGKLLAEDQYGVNQVPDGDEEAVVRLEVAETDRMVGLLMEALKENGLYENTVIVAYADHYLYTIQDKSVLARNKIVEDNRINHTPFFIWSADREYEAVNQVTMQVNILPTVLNLWGIPYNPSYYLGKDALSEDYEGVAFFADGSWYDGKVYYDGSNISWRNPDCTESEKEIEEKKQMVSDLRRKNDLTLKYDYLRQYVEE